MSFKSGFIAIVGRPNVGKSTLLNKIIGQKVAIISDKVQTTRRRLRGIFTDDRGQIVFVDTPGIHKPFSKLEEFLMDEARLSIPDADAILFVVDMTEPPGKGDKWIINNIIEHDKPIIIALNKSDLIKTPEERKTRAEEYKALFKEAKIPAIQVSAQTGRQVEELIKNLLRVLPKGPKYFPEEDITDQSMRVIAAEIIREKILLSTSEEIPHAIAVVIEEYKVDEKLTSISAIVYVEHDSQKGMIIGKNGAMIQKFGTMARVELEEISQQKVFLELTVKVKKNWRKNPSALRQFGYETKK